MAYGVSSVQGVTVLLTSWGNEDPVPLLVHYTARHSTVWLEFGISVPGEQWTKLSKGKDGEAESSQGCFLELG